MQTSQPTERPHRNHGLFSDHYLNVSLPERPDWRGLESEAAGKMEEAATAADAPVLRVLEQIRTSLEVTDFFRRIVLENPDRSGITQEVCEHVVEMADYVVRQSNGRFAFWGVRKEKDCS